MKIIREAISEELLDLILTENEDPLRRHPEELDKSEDYWGQDIIEGAKTATLVRNLTRHDPEMAEKIFFEVSPYLGEIRDFNQQVTVMMYHWLNGSLINVHKDWEYKRAASIYLNKEWQARWGGLYFWSPEDDENAFLWSAVNPQARAMVVNDENQWHAVSPVADFAKQARMSIQIFVDFHEDEKEERKAEQEPKT